MNQKTLITLLVILVILLAGTAIYFGVSKQAAYTPVARPTSMPQTPAAANQPSNSLQTTSGSSTNTTSVNNTNSTADWKVYSNAKYNFSLKYPQTLSVNEVEPSKATMQQEIIEGVVGHNYFNLTIAKNANAEVVNDGIALEVRKRENKNPAFDEKSVDLVSKQEVTIAGIKGMKYISKGGQAFSSTGNQIPATTSATFVVEKNGYVYTFHSFGSDPTYYNIIDQLVSTFKFTK